METMIQHIKICLCLLFFTFVSCQQTKNNQSITPNNKEKQIEINSPVEKNHEKDYEVWYFSTKNTSDKYSDFQILLGKDSIKVINSKTTTTICNGEIIKENESFSSYIGSTKNANFIKTQLKSLFNINIDENVQIIQNSESDISKKGCQFPFYEMFITKDLLVFYDEQYYFFTKTKESNLAIQNDSTKEYKYVKLPFDFSDYYNLCYDDDEKCKQNYHFYSPQESNNILSYFAIEENPSRVFMLPPYNGYQPIIIAYTDSDIEGYYLFIAKKQQVISSIQIAKMDGESIEDFSISKDYNITLYKRKNSKDSRKKIRNYTISKEGYIK
ncbi:hypothetical protein [Chryseobacterium salviniae]|uniref:Lipoprotein n=1 Tax=Chryseobacterium salviniae TaxID=3101750 RepID=A0ABU6HMK6_9FLAO|nr:hypothetical protein [Chryseobacterium sp. T9W2-O]MEC3874213.1 hypothetical protein [Chryseobacterium sp. T9W2-O]